MPVAHLARTLEVDQSALTRALAKRRIATDAPLPASTVDYVLDWLVVSQDRFVNDGRKVSRNRRLKTEQVRVAMSTRSGPMVTA